MDLSAFLAVLPHERLYLDHLPSADRYHKSFMHRDTINFCVTTKSDHFYPLRLFNFSSTSVQTGQTS